MSGYSKEMLIDDIKRKLNSYYGCSIENAGAINVFKACVLVFRELMTNRLSSSLNCSAGSGKHVHYMSLEFLLGRSLEKNAFNLGLTEILYEAIRDLGYEPEDFFDIEPDAALGNGGLGRLAACYLEAMTTMDIPATGYSLMYEYGIFKQKFIDGEQEEIPDKWLDIDDVWFINNFSLSQIVRFGGVVDYTTEDGHVVPTYTGTTDIRAVPADMLISGYGTETINRLRLWTAQSAADMDLRLFSRGLYLQAVEQRAMAEVITKVLYPDDNHYEGKMLRLRQQYFFVSATVQSIIRQHFERHRTLDNFYEHHAIQINDTHPTFAIPEFMRILTDEYHYEWERAWDIATRSFCYTNHTIMIEAMECWPQDIVRTLMPRIYDIILEIHRRYEDEIKSRYGESLDKKRRLSILWENQVRMANLCIYACDKINGVSELHTEILKGDIFADANEMFPGKIVNVTNGIDHRRWITLANPLLHDLICELIGDGYLSDAMELEGLLKYKNDKSVLDRLMDIRLANKYNLAKLIRQNEHITIDPLFMTDVHVKRLHEYKRQLLNVMHIIHNYESLRENPSFEMQPRTFIFGAKAAPGYTMAKRIIRLINSMCDHINADPAVADKMRVVFIENYRVSVAEKLIPGSELSEQISLAGKEASGTGNMKFMINGALTIGTLDGANVEIHELVGDDNMFVFGLKAAEVEVLRKEYHPMTAYDTNPKIRRVIERLKTGFRDGMQYADIAKSLIFDDTYCLLADFESYLEANQRVDTVYAQPYKWNAMALENIARAGFFSADRSIKDYCSKVWLR